MRNAHDSLDTPDVKTVLKLYKKSYREEKEKGDGADIKKLAECSSQIVQLTNLLTERDKDEQSH